MNRTPSRAWNDTGYLPAASRRPAEPTRPRPVPKTDPSMLNYPRDNDFTRWLAEQRRLQAAGQPNALDR